jgi:hypothetical protein
MNRFAQKSGEAGFIGALFCFGLNNMLVSFLAQYDPVDRPRFLYREGILPTQW